MLFHLQISKITIAALIVSAAIARAETAEQIKAEALRRNPELQVFEESVAARGKDVCAARLHDRVCAARLPHPFPHPLPMLCTILLKQVPHDREPFHIRWLKNAYSAALQPCVRHPALVVVVALLALLGSLALVPRIGTEFLPPLEEGSVLATIARLPSISVTQSAELATRIENTLKKFLEVITVISRTGHAEQSNDPMGVELGDTYVMIKPYYEWTTAKTKEELVAKMREAVNEIPGLSASFTQPIAMRVDELVSRVKSAIGIAR